MSVVNRKVELTRTVDGVICIEKMLANGQGFATGQQCQHQIIANAAEPNVTGVDANQGDDIDIVVSAA